jgi:alpha-maltose-1-phosphate synthase
MESKPQPSDVRALFLTREYPPEVYGGAGVHVDYLTRELAKRIAVEVRTFGTQNLWDANLVIRGHRFAQADLEDCPEKFQVPLQALRVCTRFAARPIEADVVHAHTWYAHFGGLLVKILYGLPLAITAHSLEPLRPWKREQLSRGADLAAWVERMALEEADAVIAVSQEMKADILRHFQIPSERVSVIHNGIDLQEYHRVGDRDRLGRFGIDLAWPTVLFIGRISRQKGIQHLLRAVPHLDPGTQVVLCATSPDSGEIAEEVKAGVARLHAAGHNVIWIEEMVDRPTALQLYSQASVFCCPSIYEPFGIINLEAMACETPVVASAVGGIKEVVVHEDTGLLVPLSQQPDAPFEPVRPDEFALDLARSLKRLLADPALCRRMGANGRRRVEDHFSWRAVAEATLALYRTLVQAGTPVGRTGGG